MSYGRPKFTIAEQNAIMNTSIVPKTKQLLTAYSKARILDLGSISSTNLPAVMNRDMRLTGRLRGQTDNAVAPVGFELNNPWRV